MIDRIDGLGDRLFRWLEKKYWPWAGMIFLSGLMLSIPLWIAVAPAKDHAQEVILGVAICLALGPIALYFAATLLAGVVAILVAIWIGSWRGLMDNA